jgi:hypothetical protein
MMKPGRGGQLQTERPPSKIWDSLDLKQQNAVDFLLARNVREQKQDVAKIQLAGNPPPPANDNRDFACSQAVFSCLQNLPSEQRGSCLKAEAACNVVIGLAPFPRSVIVVFPDRSRVTVPPGGREGIFHPPLPRRQ